MGGKVQSRTDTEEKLQCNTEWFVFAILNYFCRQILDGIDVVTHFPNPVDKVGISETACTFFEVGLHRQRVFMVFLSLLFKFGFNKCFNIVVTNLGKGILCLCPYKV